VIAFRTKQMLSLVHHDDMVERLRSLSASSYAPSGHGNVNKTHITLCEMLFGDCNCRS